MLPKRVEVDLWVHLLKLRIPCCSLYCVLLVDVFPCTAVWACGFWSNCKLVIDGSGIKRVILSGKRALYLIEGLRKIKVQTLFIVLLFLQELNDVIANA